MKKASLFCSALLGFIIYEGSLSQIFAGKGSYRASGHGDLGEVLKPSVWRQHQINSEGIQEELDRLVGLHKSEQAAQSDSSERVKDFHDKRDHLHHLEASLAKLGPIYEKFSLNFQSPNPSEIEQALTRQKGKLTVVEKKIQELEGKGRSLSTRDKDTLQTQRSLKTKLEEEIEALKLTPSQHRVEIAELKEEISTEEALLRAEGINVEKVGTAEHPNYIAQISVLLDMKIKSNVNLNDYPEGDVRLHEGRAISQEDLLGIMKGLGVHEDAFKSVSSLTKVRKILKSIEGFTPLEDEELTGDVIGRLAQTLEMSIGNFRLRLEEDVTSFADLIQLMQGDFSSLSTLDDVNAQEIEQYKLLLSSKLSEDKREFLFSETEDKQGQETFYKIVTNYLNLPDEGSAAAEHLVLSKDWLPYAIPGTPIGMMHRLFGTLEDRSIYSWNQDGVLSLNTTVSKMKFRGLDEDVTATFISAVHQILGRQLNLQVLEKMQESLFKLRPSLAQTEREEEEDEEEEEEEDNGLI